MKKTGICAALVAAVCLKLVSLLCVVNAVNAASVNGRELLLSPVISGNVTIRPDAIMQLPNEALNVKNFGAKGDGVADDTAAFVAVFAVQATRGGVVYCPKGTYKVTAALTPAAGVRIVGDGMQQERDTVARPTVILKHGNFTGVTLLDASTLENLSVVGDTGNGGDGIAIKGDTASLFNVGSFSHAGVGVTIGTADSTGCNWSNLRNVTSGWNGSHGFSIASTSTNANGGSFHGVRAWQNSGCGFYLGVTRANVFAGCYAEANTLEGWKILTGCVRNCFVGCSVESSTSKYVVFDSGSVDNTWLGAGTFDAAANFTDDGLNVLMIPQGAEYGKRGVKASGQFRSGDSPQHVDTVTSENGFMAYGPKPGYVFYDTLAPDSASRIWEIFANAGHLLHRCKNFDGSDVVDWLKVYRYTGYVGYDFQTSARVSFAYPPILVPMIVSQLPSPGGAITGAIAYVTDLTSVTQGVSVTGGGSLQHVVACNGSAWVVQ